MKYIKKFENRNTEHLTYSEVVELYKYDNNISEYFLETYPEENPLYYTSNYGYNISDLTIKRLKKFAKIKKDNILLDMINNREEHVKRYLKELEIKRSAEKYNL